MSAKAIALPESINSLEQLEAVIFELGEYVDWSRGSQIKQTVTGQGAKGDERVWTPEIQAILGAWSGDEDITIASVEALIRQLEAHKKTAPALHVTLAGWPSPSLRHQLVAWFRANVHPQAFVSFAVNRTILGGMVVRAGSHIHDYSWRRQFIAKRDQIPEIMRRVR